MWSTDESQKRLHMKKIKKYHQTDKSRYAIKHIKQEYLHDKGADAYVDAAW